jgi:hypothetical protein
MVPLEVRVPKNVDRSSGAIRIALDGFVIVTVDILVVVLLVAVDSSNSSKVVKWKCL